jgi:hypothetical protein
MSLLNSSPHQIPHRRAKLAHQLKLAFSRHFTGELNQYPLSLGARVHGLRFQTTIKNGTLGAMSQLPLRLDSCGSREARTGFPRRP